MIKIANVGKCYIESQTEKWVIRNLNFEIPQNKFLSIVGRSGSGKTTLLKIIGGLLTPSEGQVEIMGKDIYTMSPKKMAKYRCNTVGFVFQDYFLEELYTVGQNIEIVLMIAEYPKAQRKNAILNALGVVGLRDKYDTIVGKLSGGEKQRVCIARAIVNNPEIILADEPCGNLDWENGQMIMDMLRAQVDKGRTVVLITHNLEDAKKTDEIITLRDGEIINHEKS